MKIKICGLMRPSDIEAVNCCRPDYVGFVFAPTKRFVSDEQAMILKGLLDPSIPAVGVFVNEPIDHVVSLCERGIIDLIQLHGDETEEYIAHLRARVSNPIIRALRVQSTEQIAEADAKGFDYLLLDAYNKKMYGGTGERFQWSLIPPLNTPYFLAGGLDETNLNEAASSTGALCLDLSSSAETNSVKDPEKIRRLVSIVRSIT